MYNLVIAGFDCSDAAVCRHGYNISVIINKKPIQYQDLVFGAGDIDKLSQFLPKGCTEGFDGDIQCLNWDS